MVLFKENKGITLISLIVTIIILLILVSVTFTFANDGIIDKAVSASNKTLEAAVKEKIQLAWAEVNAEYVVDGKNNSNKTKTEYFKENLKDALENYKEFKNVEIAIASEEQLKIDFTYEKQSYEAIVSQEGNISFSTLLKGSVKVGDYIEYPIEYTDVYSNLTYTKSNGWKVVDDGVMKGTSGSVRIISTGIPAKWYYDCLEYTTSQEAKDALINNFENLELRNDSLENKKVNGSFFKVEVLASKVTTITLADLNNSCNKLYGLNRAEADVSLPDDKSELFIIKATESAYYWIATPDSDDANKLYYITDKGIKSDVDYRIGVRPVICLKDDISGVFENNIWKVID